MTFPDLTDRSLFPPFLELPEDDGTQAQSGGDVVLLAQVKDNMTITKPTLVLTDRDGTGFALVFDGLERDSLDLGKLGLKKGATAVIKGARQTVPAQSGDDSLTAKAARRPFMRVALGQAHTVLAVPTGLEQTIAIAGKLRPRQEQAQKEGYQQCEACGAAGASTATTSGDTASSAGTTAASPAKKLLKCTGCGQAWYCDRTCQTAGWSGGHKSECKALKALTAIWAE
ncbi:hypothetical protein Sste5346_000882 [Sporothrix stenoceras]|uniref:MYND-type domain-containing protein n=1 Tax=Sporothrix stenoceras TaxID=5173 RepID=A0ABR3ZS96_9PEZI